MNIEEKRKQVKLTIIESGADRQWGEVEIFLRVKGRLPQQDGDKLTAKICQDFIDRFAFHPEHHIWVPLAEEILKELEERS